MSAPQVRIRATGPTSTAIEVITTHGGVVDISGRTAKATWSKEGGDDWAEVRLTVLPDAVDLLGDLTGVTVDHIQGGDWSENLLTTELRRRLSDTASVADASTDRADRLQAQLDQLVRVARGAKGGDWTGNQLLAEHLAAHHPEVTP